MMLLQGPFRTANVAVTLSALLHIVAPVAGGFEASTFGMVPVGLFYLALAYGLSRGWRGLAYLTFLIMGFGIAAAISGAYSTSPIPSWLFGAIGVADAVAMVLLFVALWRDPSPKEA